MHLTHMLVLSQPDFVVGQVQLVLGLGVLSVWRAQAHRASSAPPYLRAERCRGVPV